MRADQLAKLRAATSLGTAVCVRGGGGAQLLGPRASEPRRRWRFWTSGGKREREGELTRGRETRACPQESRRALAPGRKRPQPLITAPPLRGRRLPSRRSAGERKRERGLGRRGTLVGSGGTRAPGTAGGVPRSEAAEGLVVSWGPGSPPRGERELARGRGRPAERLVQSCEWVSQALKQRGLVSPGGLLPPGLSLRHRPSPPAPSARGVTEAPLTRSGPAADRRGRFSRPGVGTRGLWQGAWRPLQVGRPPWSDRAAPASTVGAREHPRSGGA